VAFLHICVLCTLVYIIGTQSGWNIFTHFPFCYRESCETYAGKRHNRRGRASDTARLLVDAEMVTVLDLT
jgi:hypothetical protein